ncbi:MAG: amino acid adenylation domain-containing protein [Gemmatimonadota bacterium]
MTGLLHDSVTEAALSRPDAPAIIGEDRTFTYAELDDASNRLASLLQSYGCERGNRVAILMPNSARTVATLVGVLKAGCAYVPLDPAGGMSRIADMLRQCEPKVLLVGGCDPAVVTDLDTRGIVTGWIGTEPAPPRTDFALADIDAAAADAPKSDVGPDDLAYILFTSGTTGSPKGVPISHASARAFTDWAVKQFELEPDDRISGHTALTFDLSIFDIFVTFGAGAQLHQVPKRVRLLPHEVARFIEERKLTLWFSVPSQLAYVARFDALGDEDLSSVRHVAWCGDALATASLLYWKRRLPGVTFTNLYGPTETTVASSYYVVPESFDDPGAPIPIGTACAGEELLVLNEHLAPVPEGGVGDIYIGGVGLSPGYWRDPGRTGKVFVQDPRSPGGPERLYRTGDRGRLGPGGTVDFLGRADFQIKTGGYRVEPGEVESAVLALPEVTACVVVAVTVDNFSGSAVGCVYVASPGTTPRVGEMKKRLGDALPAYMVPSKWLALDELPLDSRGKIDRVRARSLLEAPPAPAPRPTAAHRPFDELQRT